MLFNSITFFVFFILVFISYWTLQKNKKAQNILLLLASYVFYGWWDWRFLSLIVASSTVDYFLALQIVKSKSRGRNWLVLSLIFNLGLLGVFKYYNFFAESFSELLSTIGYTPNDLTLNIILPVGISFYTFQTLSYTIDVYRNELEPTRNALSFFTYVAFFPQLVAGPIERAKHLLPQINKSRILRKSDVTAGIVQIVIGLFRKIVIADSLAVYVDMVYGDLYIYNSGTIALATVFYAFQIYYDFAGYSDIAIGTARLLGFRFNRNFNLPYFSKSLSEFWRRWHISLSSWLRDYLYISLGGNRKGIKITYRNLLLTMLIGGLWHGSAWHFIAWGGIHGGALVVEKFISSKNYFTSIRKVEFFQKAGTILIVFVAWIYFRAPSIESANHALGVIFSFNSIVPFVNDLNYTTNTLFVLTLGILLDRFMYSKNITIENLGATLNSFWISLFVSLTVVVMCLFYSTSNNFIYFQF